MSPRSNRAWTTGYTTWSIRRHWRLLQSRPTVNIEGLVGGYTGPGGKTILPHRAVAKLDLRLVPDMKAEEALCRSQSPLGQAWLRRYRSQHDWRLRSQQHVGRRPVDPRRRWLSIAARESIPLSCRAALDHGPDTSSPAIPCTCLPAISGWATAAAPTRPTSIT